MHQHQGHWVLAQVGKKVLRPGGRELTEKMIDGLNISFQDSIVEFAPGIGFTASLALRKKPYSYTGVELDREVSKNLSKHITGERRDIICANAKDTGLDVEKYDKVYGEVMLTMQSEKQKQEIVSEARRILRKGGLYGIHELYLIPDTLSEEEKIHIQKELSFVIHVNARPLTEVEWKELFEKEGFRIISGERNPMALLELRRILQNEGFWRTLKIFFNILTKAHARKRIFAMRRIFKKYKNHLGALVIIGEKV